MYNRYAAAQIQAAMQDTPVVMIAGPRQCGKTTLAKQLTNSNWTYITFDDLTQLQLAKHDPVGFIQHLASPHSVLDEIQRVPELFLSIKQSVDERREPGRFLLTGSANVLLMPQVADSLAGRVEIIPLLPLSECEIRGVVPTFLSQLLQGKVPTTSEIRIRSLLIEKIIAGGFPEPLSRPLLARKHVWYQQYLSSLIQKDMREISHIEHLNAVTQFLQLLAGQIGQITNYSELGAKIGLSRQTVARYFNWLERLYLIENLPAWHRNHHKRLIKSPKVHFIDTGLLCALRRITPSQLTNDPHLLGPCLENYIFCELKKQASWLDEPLYFFHYRDKDKVEVDFVLQKSDGQIMGIEVKAGATINASSFQGLKRLQEISGNDFLIGILLYDGDHTIAFDDKIYAVPISAIWH
jgi:hypothetical protein